MTRSISLPPGWLKGRWTISNGSARSSGTKSSGGPGNRPGGSAGFRRLASSEVGLFDLFVFLERCGRVLQHDLAHPQHVAPIRQAQGGADKVRSSMVESPVPAPARQLRNGRERLIPDSVAGRRQWSPRYRISNFQPAGGASPSISASGPDGRR